MSHQVFTPITIKSMTMANRFLRSATWEGMCDPDGRPTPRLADLYRQLAEGGVGCIISGYTFISPEGRQLPGKMGIHTDEFAGAYRELVDGVHQAGGRLCVQLVHAGGQTDTKTAGRRPLAPSAVAVDQFPEVPEPLSQAEIQRLVAAFAAGAARAKAWGVDAVQLHGAHGYLISQFLSPHTNRRDDEYGGSLENRARFLLEVLAAVRQAVGDDYPVLIKMNCSDFLPDGLTIDEAVGVARLLDANGIDGIEVSGGTPASGALSPVRVKIDRPEREAYHLAPARQIKRAVSCPVFCVGGFRSLAMCEAAVTGSGLDGVSLARPLIREPHLIRRWQAGDTRPAACISCNGCFKPGLKEGGIRCVVADKEKAEEKTPA